MKEQELNTILLLKGQIDRVESIIDLTTEEKDKDFIKKVYDKYKSLNDFKMVELKDLKDKYQKVYGPLSIYYPCNKWRWLEEPWPWERGNF